MSYLFLRPGHLADQNVFFNQVNRLLKINPKTLFINNHSPKVLYTYQNLSSESKIFKIEVF
jgi:hypothetical protein